MRISWARPALVAAVVVALAGGGTAVALADTSTPPTTSSPSAAPTTKAPAKKARHPLARRVEHGEVTLHGKAGDRTVDLQRGVVTASSPTSVTVRSTDGFTQTYAFTPTSKVRKQKAASQASAVAVNDRVGVVAAKGAQGLTVTRLRDAGPAPAK
ncbi:hypothetical protein LQ327_19975 [Actinomycetospora endophytica]|uniref:DUF5666 domain-containing protein n=1 Tax=Actinomycetospora endophytica TaxID=2291215 RepID=A0ABS8PBL5_9PSEU|nr:hypothetical protein [Actinomycetospora endophytica]MCD2195653.1 hypothetical protein [Actinomycetospora endophytica]